MAGLAAVCLQKNPRMMHVSKNTGYGGAGFIGSAVVLIAQ